MIATPTTPHPAGRSDEVLDRIAEAIEAARCPHRQGPYGGFDYGHPDGKGPEGGRYVVRDFRDPRSPDWGKWVHQTADRAEHEAAYDRMTRRHVARSAMLALLEAERTQLRASWEAQERELREALTTIVKQAMSFEYEGYLGEEGAAALYVDAILAALSRNRSDQ